MYLDTMRPYLVASIMKIVNVIHKGLRRFIEDDDASGLPAQFSGKIRKIVEFLQAMESEDELHALPLWKPHQLTGDRAGTWSLFVSRNWRLTFKIEGTQLEIIDLDYEDYH